MNKMAYISMVLFIVLTYAFFPLVRVLKYNVTYNPERIIRGIPVLPRDWKRQSLSRSELIYTNPWASKEKRYHLKKTIMVDGLMNIEKETDYFVIEDKNVVIDARYDYKNDDHWYIWYYHRGDSLDKRLSYIQFIDTLKKYDIDIKH